MQWPFRRAQYEAHSGSDSYKYIDYLFRKSAKLLIISPYIDEYYARKLRKLSNKKKVYIISSSVDKNAKAILLGKHIDKGLFVLSSATWLIAVLLMVLDLELASLSLATISLVLSVWLAIKFVSSGKSRVIFKAPRKFVHIKLYVGDSLAIQGSANLTYKGMHSNVEHVEIIRDKVAVGRMADEFWKIWDNY